MKISIVTVTYNSEAFLQTCIDSVVNQKHVDIQHIIIDGCSQDRTLDIIEKNLSNISTYISEPDRGIYDAMNKGLRLATGDIVGILNSDDFYPQQDILADVERAFQDESVQCVYGNLQYVDRFNTNKVKRNWTAGAYFRKSFLNGWMPPHPSFFVRREIYEQYGNFDLSFKTSADYELMLRFLYRHSLNAVYLPRILVKMRSGGLSNSSFNHRLIANKEDLRAWKKNHLKPKVYTMLLKPLRKIPQYLSL